MIERDKLQFNKFLADVVETDFETNTTATGTVTIQQRIQLDTIKTIIPLTEMYPLEELQNSVVTQSSDSHCNLKFTTAEGKMSDYRWFFWMVICCSAATFLVTFLAWKRTDPTYDKK